MRAHATRAGSGLECAIAVAGLLFALPAVLVAQAECGGSARATGFGCMRAEEVGFTSTGVELAGDWYTPLQGGRHPAVVLVHGAGAMDRLGPGGYLVETAGYFVSRGFAVLSFDKRGTGASNGDWRVMGFEDLAGDVAAAVAMCSWTDGPAPDGSSPHTRPSWTRGSPRWAQVLQALPGAISSMVILRSNGRGLARAHVWMGRHEAKRF